MILILKRDKIILIGLIILLSAAIYTLRPQYVSTVVNTSNEGLKKIVLLDPGHGGEDPGAVSDYNGIREKEINLYIAQKAKEYLEMEGFKVLLTREEDILQYSEGTKGYDRKREQDLLKRKKMMDECGADIVVSIHLNMFEQSQYKGAQAFFPPRSAESKKLAECLQKAVREGLDPENKREALVKNTQLIIFRNIKTPTAIMECGFLSNREEEQKLASKEYQDKLALAIKEGIMEYYRQ
ncbi:MAG: N-acetylmuramoyl-L-alanine amidase CwlD [Clostridiaceae bacterium]|nr:N-acetylmuramoyl-L-alanine amidase CwlD [Clostridiaceae bacterium]